MKLRFLGTGGIAEKRLCCHFLHVDEDGFRKHEPNTLADLAASFTEYKV